MEHSNQATAQPETLKIDCWQMGYKKLIEKQYLTGLAQDRRQYFTYASTLNIGKHNNLSLDEVLDHIAAESQLSTGNTSRQDLRHTLQQEGPNSDQVIDEEELLYGINQWDEQADEQTTYEERRHELAGPWNY